MNDTATTPIGEFTTDRLAVRNWAPLLDIGDERQRLETALTGILTPRVLEHLPEPLQLSSSADAVSEWIEARLEESEVSLVYSNQNGPILGVLILAKRASADPVRKIHIGYLLAEEAWGKGYATELVSGFAKSLERGPRTLLIGGVGQGNVASARVLTKAGFRLSETLSTPETDMFVYGVPQQCTP